MDALFETKSPIVIKIDVDGHGLAILRERKEIISNPSLLGVLMELNGSGARYGISDEATKKQILFSERNGRIL